MSSFLHFCFPGQCCCFDHCFPYYRDSTARQSFHNYNIALGEEDQETFSPLKREVLIVSAKFDYESMEERVYNDTECKSSGDRGDIVSASKNKIINSDKKKDVYKDSLEDLFECVICLGEFDSANPLIPTLCNCGENRTHFHLPCLLAWIDKNKNEATCPSCGGPLYFEEAS